MNTFRENLNVTLSLTLSVDFGLKNGPFVLF